MLLSLIPFVAGDAAARVIDGNCVLMRLDSAGQVIFHSLNDVATSIWGLIDGKRSIADIIACLGQEYEADPQGLADDCFEFLNRLKSQNLIALDSESRAL